MSDSNKLISATIDQYLLGIAEGLQVASHALARPKSGTSDGVVSTTYVLPKLDFELSMSLSLTQSPAIVNKRLHQASSTSVIKKIGEVQTSVRPALLLQPPSTESGGLKAQGGDVYSRISGTFLAVPASEARSALHIASFLRLAEVRKLEITVQMKDELGQPVVGSEVHFNVDRQAANVSAATNFDVGVVVSDPSGSATAILTIGPSEPVGADIAVVVDAGGQVENILYRFEG